MEALFRKFRNKQGEVWQLGSYESPVWTLPEEEGGRPFRPRVAICRSVRTGRLEVAGYSPAEPGPEAFREAVVLAVRAWRLRPERIEVDDARLAEEMGGFLAAEGVPVERRDELPELRAALEERTRALRTTVSPPSLSVAGLTVERMASFARAAADFAAAAPWRHLSPEDIVVLASDGLPEELRCVEVLPAPLTGVLFHAEEPETDFELWPDGGTDVEGLDDEEKEEDAGELWDEEEPSEEDEDGPLDPAGLWRVNLAPPYLIPSEDVELWMQHDLPLAHARAYPLAFRLRPGKGSERPDARLLSWFEVVLAALAATTVEEMDTGRWEKEVLTAEGPVRLALSLPGMLEPAFVESFAVDEGEEPLTPAKLAEELADEAEDAQGRRQIHLARRAIALAPGCIEAWLVLARRALSPEAARDLYAQAVAAGERLLPRAGQPMDWFLRMEKRLDILPYILARIGLAKALWDLGAREAAAGHFQGILDVDPDDPERVRYLWAHALLALGRDGEAEDLLVRFAEDRAAWHYTRALLTFRREGDSPAARRPLADALRSHAITAQILLRAGPAHWIGPRNQRDTPDAVILRDVWADIPGALDWLRSQSAAAAKAPQARKKKRTGRKGRKKRRR
jgi:tetratricopeptide (TPR) repeat protein